MALTSHDSEGTEGGLDLTQWLEKMEYVFHISNYTTTNQLLDHLDIILSKNVPAGQQRSPVGRKRVKLVSSRVAPGGRVVRRVAEVSSGGVPEGRDILSGGTMDL
ncbi:hypothetical protein Tco_1249340 [Tanacetum coccineum]